VKEGKISMANLDAIAVSKGPGSYTGLRIGVSAAKGLSYALDVPLIAIPTLAVLAAFVEERTVIIPILDARRMEVYSAVYNDDKQEIRETKAEIVEENSFTEYLSSKKVTFVGNGVSKFREICEHPNAIFIENIQPSAVKMALLAEYKYKKNDIEDVAYFEPFYLKDFKIG